MSRSLPLSCRFAGLACCAAVLLFSTGFWVNRVAAQIVEKSSSVRSVAGQTHARHAADAPRSAAIPGDEKARPLTARGRNNLTALASAYGHVAYFDATDEAAAADWPLLLIDAVERVERASDPAALALALNEAIEPHAPDFCAYASSADESCPPQKPAPGFAATAWVHRGLGVGHYLYSSHRERLTEFAADRLLTVKLGKGVMARVPIAAALAEDGRTVLRPTRHPALSRKPLGWTPSGFDRSTRLANVIAVWARFQHFYPYFDVVRVDWAAMLAHSLDRAATDEDDLAFLDTLNLMTAGLADGHAGLFYSRFPKTGTLPVAWAWVDERLVVTGTASDTHGLQPGDVIEAIDGKSVEALIASRRRFISGSTQWRRLLAVGAIKNGVPGKSVTLAVVRAGKRSSASLTFGEQLVTERRPETLSEIRPGIIYIDLSRTRGEEVIAAAPRLAASQGLVFDLRGYPLGEPKFLSHLASAPFQSVPFRTPIVRQPNRVGWSFDEVLWKMTPLLPRFPKSVFLTDERALSYSESILGTVKGNRLGTIIGEPTGGANGNVSPISLPGGYVVASTGMQVLGADRSVHHNIGVLPDITVKRSLAGVRAGRDELLDAGIEHLTKAR